MHIIEQYISEVLSFSCKLFIFLQMFNYVITTAAIKNSGFVSSNSKLYSSSSEYQNEFTTTEYEFDDLNKFHCKCWIFETNPMVSDSYKKK